MARRLLPGFTRREFWRSTPAEVEEMIDGALWRIEQRRDAAAELAAWIMIGAGGKFTDGSIPAARHFLGRDVLPLDPRRPEPSAEVDPLAAVDEEIEADKRRRAEALIDAALMKQAILDRERRGQD